MVCVGTVGAWNFVTGASLYCQLQLYKQVYTNIHRNLMCKLYTLYSNTQYTTFTKYYKADLRRVADDNIYSAYLIRKASQNRINVLQVDRVAVHTAYGITWRRGEEWGECQPKMVSIVLILPQCMHTFVKILSDGHR